MNIKYLGLTIDMNLNFDFHISNIAYKISRTVGIISKIRHYLPETALLKIYYALIHSHLLYGLIIWGSTFPTYFQKLITLQNKAVKFICAAKFCDNSSPYYKRLKILKLKDLYKLEVGKFIHSNFKKMLPKNLSNYFILTSQISEKNTRLNEKSKKTLHISFCKTSRLQRCIRVKYQEVKIWNEIPILIQNASYRVFKYEVKKYLLKPYI